jgi:DNA-binding GntR family transcriptional regulator
LQNDKPAYIEEDIAFHQLIVTGTGNDQLSRIHSNIQDKLWLCRCQTYQLTSPDTPSAHKEIAESLAFHDRNAAREATQTHIRFVRNALLAEIERAPQS